MKKLIIILIIMGAFGFAYAQDKQIAEKDADHKLYWVSAYDVVTIAADTAITKGIVAITPETDVNVYFGTDDTNDFLVTAGTLFAVNQNYDVKLKTNTVCLVY